MRLIQVCFCLCILGWPVLVSADSEVKYQIENREANFAEFVSDVLEPFWQQRAFVDSFENHQQLTIHYAYIRVPNSKRSVVVSPGRVEGYLKYKELAYDLVQQGYSVFIIDHQGQGLSSRRLSNQHKGYVETYDDYVNDFHQFIEEVVKPNSNEAPLLLLSHSMGGAIGLRYIQRHPTQFKQAVFSSPMWALDSGPLPKSIAKSLIAGVAWGGNLFSDDSPYFVGSTDYNPPTFEDNVLTHSRARYEYFRQVYASEPKVQLGGITVKWIDASIKAIDNAMAELDKIQIPILVLQSEQDKVIDNQGHFDVCKQLQMLNKPCSFNGPLIIEGAEHELFIEEDDKRNLALSYIFKFYANPEG